jgi:hypothetical protein
MVETEADNISVLSAGTIFFPPKYASVTVILTLAVKKKESQVQAYFKSQILILNFQVSREEQYWEQH